MPRLLEILNDDNAPVIQSLLMRGFTSTEEAIDDLASQIQFLPTNYVGQAEDRAALLAYLRGFRLPATRGELVKDDEDTDVPSDHLPLGPSPQLLPPSESPFDHLPFLGPDGAESPFDVLAPEAALPHAVDLTDRFGPVREQGGRNTCVAFAALAIMEYFLRINGPDAGLSEQFLYWACKQIDGRNETGTFLRFAFNILPANGCCIETVWPYNVAAAGSATDAQGPPPPNARIDAAQRRTTARIVLAHRNVNLLRQALAQGRPVALSIGVQNIWWNSLTVRRTGDVPFISSSVEPVTGSHAVCLVGYDDGILPDLSQGRFIFRNSFGSRFGMESHFGLGYGTLPYTFVTNYAFEAFTLT